MSQSLSATVKRWKGFRNRKPVPRPAQMEDEEIPIFTGSRLHHEPARGLLMRSTRPENQQGRGERHE